MYLNKNKEIIKDPHIHLHLSERSSFSLGMRTNTPVWVKRREERAQLLNPNHA